MNIFSCHDNVLITDDHEVISRDWMIKVPGCICACLVNNNILITVSHTDENTTEVVAHYPGRMALIIHTFDGHLDIINVFQLPKRYTHPQVSYAIALSNSEGIIYIHNGNERCEDIPSNTIGMCSLKFMSSSKYGRFNNNSRWNKKSITSDGYSYTHNSEVQSVYFDDKNPKRTGGYSLQVILSDSVLTAVYTDFEGYSSVTEQIPGNWITYPRMLKGNLYCVDNDGVVRDLSMLSGAVRRFYGMSTCEKLNEMRAFDIKQSINTKQVSNSWFTTLIDYLYGRFW